MHPADLQTLFGRWTGSVTGRFQKMIRKAAGVALDATPRPLASGCQELGQEFRRFGGIVLREEMTTLH
jgi:hypothetical protein